MESDRVPVTTSEWVDHGYVWHMQNLDLAPSEYWRKKALKERARRDRKAAAMRADGELTLRQAWDRLPDLTHQTIVFGIFIAAIVLGLFLAS